MPQQNSCRNPVVKVATLRLHEWCISVGALFFSIFSCFNFDRYLRIVFIIGSDLEQKMIYTRFFIFSLYFYITGSWIFFYCKYGIIKYLHGILYI